MIQCPKCQSEYGYSDGMAYNCPECGHMWTDHSLEEEKVLDAVGNELKEGDDVTIIRDLKMGKDTLKRGTRAKNIRILDEPKNGHDLEGRVDGVGALYLKSEVVKKM
ncbi:zinc ribbon domain-containing protein YjdM [Atopobacter phocae]|uniref:zinc ribbon domain-containing protein YjdM n=1 Tax=Atopobacter phocae TaxID=136492 RepID=UPI00046F19AF|nr:zinc ribbon domain-containing protein YjdM [Atopobacter phocae]